MRGQPREVALEQLAEARQDARAAQRRRRRPRGNAAAAASHRVVHLGLAGERDAAASAPRSPGCRRRRSGPRCPSHDLAADEVRHHGQDRPSPAAPSIGVRCGVRD